MSDACPAFIGSRREVTQTRLRDIGKAHQGILGLDGLSDLAHTAAAPFALCRRPFWIIVRLEPGADPGSARARGTAMSDRLAPANRPNGRFRKPSLKYSATEAPSNGLRAYRASETPGFSSGPAPAAPVGAAVAGAAACHHQGKDYDAEVAAILAAAPGSYVGGAASSMGTGSAAAAADLAEGASETAAGNRENQIIEVFPVHAAAREILTELRKTAFSGLDATKAMAGGFLCDGPPHDRKAGRILV